MPGYYYNPNPIVSTAWGGPATYSPGISAGGSGYSTGNQLPSGQGFSEYALSVFRLYSQTWGLQINTPEAIAALTAQDQTATSDIDLLAPMRAMAIGQPIPVVFARRRTGGTGGVMVQPKATEFQVSNTSSTLTFRYHCVLGDGPMGDVQVRDVRNALSRSGSFEQNYNRRAGIWVPGNRASIFYGYLPGGGSQATQIFPYICGGGGNYRGMSTISFANTYPVDSDAWKYAWNVFIRSGLIIERGRLIDSVVGPSDNICDLLIWALVKSGRMTEADIDMPLMLRAAKFVEVNQLFCNAEFSTATSLPDFIVNILPAFLLRDTTINGKFAVIPLLPINEDGTLSTGTIQVDWTLTEEIILPDSYSQQRNQAATRAPLEVVATWRQQTSDTEPALNRTLTVGQDGDTDAAVDMMELKGFCTSVRHAAMAAGYRHAIRTLAGATATVSLAPGDQTGYMLAGQVVRVRLQIVQEWETYGVLSDTWQISTVTLNSDGTEVLQLREFPLTADGQSLITQRVIAARDGALDIDLPYPDIAAGDEAGRSTDTTVPPSSSGGMPFTDGGGLPPTDRPGGVDTVRMPPVGPPTRDENDPPTDDGGDGVSQGGGEPTRSDKKTPGTQTGSPWTPYKPGKIGPITAYDWPGNCKEGVSIIRTKVKGCVIVGAGTIWSVSAIDATLQTIEPIQAEPTGFRTIIYQLPGNVNVPVAVMRYALYIQEPIPYAPRTMFVDDLNDAPNPSENLPFSLDVLDWRCRMRDGTPGPLKTPQDVLEGSP